MKQVDEKLNGLKEELDEMGVPPPVSNREKSNYLMTLIADFANDYKNTLSGRYVANNRNQSEEIGKGAVIKEKFRNIFKEFFEDYVCSADYDD